jgi:hypothetical protein
VADGFNGPSLYTPLELDNHPCKPENLKVGTASRNADGLGLKIW